MTELFPDIPSQLERIGTLDINFRMVGQGLPILLLHGYPQSHVIWHGVVKSLSPRYTLVMPDMRGYGDSSKPPSDPEHANYSKKSMASDMVSLMTNLGFDQFFFMWPRSRRACSPSALLGLSCSGYALNAS